MTNQSVRVRIAPSPTGNLHVGTARAALFNELFARNRGGTFIIRIEDTDKARSTAAFEANILESLAWLGLKWNEGPDIGGEHGPYRQSERTAFYEAAIKKLIDEGKAYVDAAANNVVKLKVTPQDVSFEDRVRGTVTTHSDSWGGDFVIARSLNDPLFHLAVVVDDAAQAITHVIRGDDHISNTARHILIQRALGVPTPTYAHVPLLLDEQRRKLSKRAGDVSLLAYRDQGYLPHAVLNYLALLGWSPKNDQEFFTHDELATAFSLEAIQKAGAVFSLTKLQAVNKHYLRQLSPAELLQHAQPFLENQGITVDNEAYWQAALACEQERSATLQELAAAVTFFGADWAAPYDASLLVWKKSTPEATAEIMQKLTNKLETFSDVDFTAATLQEKLMAWIDEEGIGRGDALWPLRVALTGKEHSPGPFEVAAVLGKAGTLHRLSLASSKLKS